MARKKKEEVVEAPKVEKTEPKADARTKFGVELKPKFQGSSEAAPFKK